MDAARSSRRASNLAWALSTAVAAAWISILVSGVGGAHFTQTISNLGLSAVALAASVACATAVRGRSGRERRLWALLSASAFSWGAGQVTWTWYETVLGREVPFPSLADVGYLAGTVFAVLALLSVPTGPQSLAARIRTVIDGLMIAASLLVTSWLLVLGPVFRAGGDTLAAQAISLAYPIGDVIVMTIVLYVLLRARHTKRTHGLPLGLLAAGLCGLSIADSGFAYLAAVGSYSSGNLIDSGWFIGYLLILLAAIKPARAEKVAESDAEDSRPLGLLLPYFAVTVAVATSSFELAKDGQVPVFISWIRTFIVVAMVVRQILTLLENLSLTRHLEARVIERTSELRASEQRFQALVQHSSDVVTVVDEEARIVYQSDSIERVFGYAAGSLLGEPVTALLDSGNGERLREALRLTASEPYGMRVLELPVVHWDGRLCHAEITITNLLSNPDVGGLVLNSRDISERKTLEEQLVHEAFHDSLTRLANRALFKDRVEHTLRRRDRLGVSVLFLDLDGFKEVNDSLGHASGDLLLVAVAARLRACVRDEDTVARLGGDEFAVLIEDVADSVDPIELAERIIEGLREPFSIEDHELHVRASIGIAMANGDVDDADQLLRNADLSMYRAKAAGGGGSECYDPAMHADLVERLQVAADLRRALEADELVLHYQPTLELASGEITGVEALVRWQHPTRGLVPPMQFIPLAEDTGLIRPLGRWVLQQACLQAVAWQREYPERAPLKMNVNISACQLRQTDLVDDVEAALADSGLAPEALVLEMTESVLMEHTDDNLTVLERLKELGVRLAIDDFGTGYSSLSYLHRFPVDVLKIDRSFVERLAGRSRDGGLVKTIVRLGQSLRLETVAEGIEDHAQFLALKRLGCELGQGFYFSRPVPAAEIDALLGDPGKIRAA